MKKLDERVGTVSPYPAGYSPAHFIEKNIGELSSNPPEVLWEQLKKLKSAGALSLLPSNKAPTPELARVILQAQFTIQQNGPANHGERAKTQGTRTMPPKKKNPPAESAKKEAKPKDESTPKATPGRNRRFQPDAKIKVLVKENPKRAGTEAAERFDLYSECKTVQDYVNAGGRTSDIAWDVKRNYISVG
jgi:hypothetical protein